MTLTLDAVLTLFIGPYLNLTELSRVSEIGPYFLIRILGMVILTALGLSFLCVPKFWPMKFSFVHERAEDVDIECARRAKKEKPVLVRFGANTGVEATTFRRSENNTAD